MGNPPERMERCRLKDYRSFSIGDAYSDLLIDFTKSFIVLQKTLTPKGGIISNLLNELVENIGGINCELLIMNY